MVWLSKPLGASGAVFEDIAQPSNTKARTKRAAENIDAFFIRSSSAKREFHLHNVLSHRTPLVEAGSTFTAARAGSTKAACERAAFAVFPFLRSFFFCLVSSSACNYFGLITPNVPARLPCGPAVKKS